MIEYLRDLPNFSRICLWDVFKVYGRVEEGDYDHPSEYYEDLVRRILAEEEKSDLKLVKSEHGSHGSIRKDKDMNANRCYRCRAEGVPLTRVPDGHRVCRACLDKYYEKCDVCGTYADKDEILYTGGLCECCFDDEDE